MNTQQAEIDVLKTQVKTLKRIVHGVVCLLVAGIALNACSESKSIPDVIQAKKFLVVNDEGKGVAQLSTSWQDGGLLSIRNKDGKGVANVYASSDGGRLRLHNPGEITPSVLLSAGPLGGLLAIADKHGRAVARLSPARAIPKNNSFQPSQIGEINYKRGWNSVLAIFNGGEVGIYDKDEELVFSAP